ncbi:helix-turn-helix transcriptional regulator [Streptomyces sp. NPDC002838]|uniref:helix-turn-helix domain-containing protein n=1 Tax=Streptomyces sp. NPDC002838 TaxID=3154436 RepID=UPI00332558F9
MAAVSGACVDARAPERFCQVTGLSRRTLQRIESGAGDPRYRDLLMIAAALDMRASVLVD